MVCPSQRPRPFLAVPLAVQDPTKGTCIQATISPVRVIQQTRPRSAVINISTRATAMEAATPIPLVGVVQRLDPGTRLPSDVRHYCACFSHHTTPLTPHAMPSLSDLFYLPLFFISHERKNVALTLVLSSGLSLRTLFIHTLLFSAAPDLFTLDPRVLLGVSRCFLFIVVAQLILYTTIHSSRYLPAIYSKYYNMYSPSCPCYRCTIKKKNLLFTLWSTAPLLFHELGN